MIGLPVPAAAGLPVWGPGAIRRRLRYGTIWGPLVRD